MTDNLCVTCSSRHNREVRAVVNVVWLATGVSERRCLTCAEKPRRQGTAILMPLLS